MNPEQNLSSGTCVIVRGKADNAHPLLLQSCCCCKLASAVGTAGALAWIRQDLCHWATNLHWCHSYLVLRTTSLAAQNLQDWLQEHQAKLPATLLIGHSWQSLLQCECTAAGSTGESNVTCDNFLKGISSWWSWPLTGTQPGSDWPILLGICLAIETEPSSHLNPKTFFETTGQI